MTRIRPTAKSVSLDVESNDPPTAKALVKALPNSATVNTWGDEIYFETPVGAKPSADARAEMVVGEFAHWPLGMARCVFFGRTPACIGQEPRAASLVNSPSCVLGDARSAGKIAERAEATVSLSAARTDSRRG